MRIGVEFFKVEEFIEIIIISRKYKYCLLLFGLDSLFSAQVPAMPLPFWRAHPLRVQAAAHDRDESSSNGRQLVAPLRCVASWLGADSKAARIQVGLTQVLLDVLVFTVFQKLSQDVFRSLVSYFLSRIYFKLLLN